MTLLDFYSLAVLSIIAAAYILIRDVLFIPPAIISATSTLSASIFSSIILLIFSGLDIAEVIEPSGATLTPFSSTLLRIYACNLSMIKGTAGGFSGCWLLTLSNACWFPPCFFKRWRASFSEAFSSLCLR